MTTKKQIHIAYCKPDFEGFLLCCCCGHLIPFCQGRMKTLEKHKIVFNERLLENLSVDQHFSVGKGYSKYVNYIMFPGSGSLHNR